MPLTPADLHLPLVWLLELEWAGQTWRFAASREEAPFGSSGSTAVYWPGLFIDDSYESTIDLFNTSPSDRAMPVVLDASRHPEIDPPTLAERGHRLGSTLGSATARLYLWPRGSSRRQLVLAGLIDDPEYGTKDEPLTFTVSERPWEDSATWPPEDARVTSTTWPSRDVDIDSEFYPWVFGAPGVSGTLAFGSPGLIVDAANDLVLIAGHPSSAGNVEVYNETTGNSGTYAISNVADGLGRTCTLVDCTGITGGINDGDEVWIIWITAAGLSGAAGDVLEYMLRRSSLRWDRGRLVTLMPRLNGFQFDTYLQPDPKEPAAPWAWLVSTILDHLPASVCVGENGLILAWFDLDAPAVARLEADRDLTRISAVTYIGTGEVVNDLRVNYQPRAQSDSYRGYRFLTGSQERLDAPSFNTTAFPVDVALASVHRYGVRSSSLSLDGVYDRPTAVKIAAARVRALALPPRQVSYLARGRFAWLEPGTKVKLVDSELGWDEVDAIVWTSRQHPLRPEITFRLYEAPRRPTS